MSTEKLEGKIAKLVGNPIVFLQVSTLKKLTQKASINDIGAFNEAIDALSNSHFFVGELLFQAPHDLEITLGDNFDALQAILKPFGIELGDLNNYNTRSDLEAIHKTALTSDHGTARRDKVREYLDKIFKNGDQPDLINQITIGFGNESEELCAIFSLTDEGQEFVHDKEIGNEQLAEATNGSLKRIIRRAFLKEFKSDMATDSKDAIDRLDSEEATSFEVETNKINVWVPLTETVHGAFKGGTINYIISKELAKEVEYNLRLAAALN